MKEYFSLSFKKREKIIKKIKETLLRKDEVIFAYIFGSFLDSPSFRDIDVGVYLKKGIKEEKIFETEFNLAEEMAKVIPFPSDIIEIKILNFVPLSFQNNIFKKGKLLFSKDEKLLSDLIEESSLEAIANSHIAYQSLRELVPA